MSLDQKELEKARQKLRFEVEAGREFSFACTKIREDMNLSIPAYVIAQIVQMDACREAWPELTKALDDEFGEETRKARKAGQAP